MDFPGGSAGKESACNVGHLGLIPGLGRLSGEMNGCPFQYSSLENSMDCIVHGVAKSQTGLSNFHFHFHWIIEKAREFQKKTSTFASLTTLKPLDHNKLWEILKLMGVPDHLTCLLRNLYVDQEATVRTRHGTAEWLKIIKGV